MITPRKIRPKVRNTIISALSAGVVPSTGLQYVQVGRASEVKAMIRSLESVADGGAIFRMVVGDYGAGKTFFLHVVRQLAFEYKLVTVHADLSPERRLVASGGQARKLYSELVSNMATRAKPEGGALAAVIEMFVAECTRNAEVDRVSPRELILDKLKPLTEYVGGWDFSKVIAIYCEGHEQGNDDLKQSALRWLKGEFTTKTDARKELNVRTIIDDSMFYDAIKLLTRFVTIAGHGGLFVMLDEAVNLFKITNTQSRTHNYEMVLRMLNDTLQSGAGSDNLGLLIGITPEALYDPRRGLCSYEALNSRLAPNQFAKESGLVDFNQPTIHLPNLSPEELYLLYSNIRLVFSSGDVENFLLSDDELITVMQYFNETLGAAYFNDPRKHARQFTQLLSLMEQHPGNRWNDLVAQVKPQSDELTPDPSDDGLASFTL